MHQKLPVIPKPASCGHYTYKCNKCGTPHQHRNRNKYPELCVSCAKSQAKKDYWADQRVAAANDALLTSFFRSVRIDLARKVGRLENAT